MDPGRLERACSTRAKPHTEGDVAGYAESVMERRVARGRQAREDIGARGSTLAGGRGEPTCPSGGPDSAEDVIGTIRMGGRTRREKKIGRAHV